MDATAAPSARIIAERPKPRCEKKCEKTTMRRYFFAHSRASALTPSPPHQPRIVSRLKYTSGGRTKKNASLKATSWPRSFSHAAMSRSPRRIERTAECPAPTKTPNAAKSIITGKESVSAAIDASPHPWPM